MTCPRPDSAADIAPRGPTIVTGRLAGAIDVRVQTWGPAAIAARWPRDVDTRGPR